MQNPEFDELEASDVEEIDQNIESEDLEEAAAELEAYGGEDIVAESVDDEQDGLEPSEFDLAAASDPSAAMTGWIRITKTQGFFNCPSDQAMRNAAYSYCANRGYAYYRPGTMSGCFHVNGWPSLRRRFFYVRCSTTAAG